MVAACILSYGLTILESRALHCALIGRNTRPLLLLNATNAQALQALEARSEEASAAAEGLRATLRATEEELEQSKERLRQTQELRAKEAEKAREALDAARKALEESEADGAERSRERSARAAGLQDVLREQGALLAERFVLPL